MYVYQWILINLGNSRKNQMEFEKGKYFRQNPLHHERRSHMSRILLKMSSSSRPQREQIPGGVALYLALR